MLGKEFTATAQATVTVNQDLTCSEDDQIVYGSVSLTNFKVKLPGAECPTCVSCQNCDLFIESVNAYLDKKYPNADWLSPSFLSPSF